MNKQILSFFAGIFLVILTAAATGVTEFKPANPKSTVCFTGTPDQLKDYVLYYSKQGYVTKLGLATSQGSSGRYENGLIIMEKY